MNRVNGPLPSCIGDMKQLTAIDAHKNQISGTIPAGLATLKGLKMLDLSENVLRGAVPDALGALDLDVLNLGQNPKLDPPNPEGALKGKLTKRRLKTGRNRMN